MKTYTTIIVEDTKDHADFLQKMLEKHCPFVMVVAICATAKKAEEEIRKRRPDFIFLDVELGNSSGFDLLYDLRDMNFKVIFVTVFKKYMLEALRASAADFLHKPFTEKQLAEAVSRVINAIEKSSLNLVNDQLQKILKYVESPMIIKSILRLPDNAGIHPIHLQNLVYCEAKGNRTAFFSVDKKDAMMVSQTLGEFEELLEPYGFVRIHQSFIINLLQIDIYKRRGADVIMKGYPDNELAIARGKKEWFDEVYKNFTLGN